MSAWEEDTLSNDNAADWLLEVESAEYPVSMIQEALDRVAARRSNGAPDEAVALAAAELVAAAFGHPSPKLGEVPENVLKAAKSSELRSLACVAISRIRECSDLVTVWADADGAAKWSDAVLELGKRLQA